MRRVLLIFIDGLGLGDNDPASNPLVRFPTPGLQAMFGRPLTRDIGRVLADDVCLIPTDATLGVAGLPQSATGQTALFTGINAARLLGHHTTGFPGPQLAKIIGEHGIMRELVAMGHRVTSANMYTPNYLELVARRRRRHSATTLTILATGLPLRSLHELAAGQAVYQDITNAMLPELGVAGVPAVRPATAGERLVALACDHNFTMFEYFQTDRCGHARDWRQAAAIVATLDEFCGAVRRHAPDDLLVVITSDHGNFEDLTRKTHTTNPVPTVIFGPDCRAVGAGIVDLTDVKPAIVAFLE
jgi:hypothetical protein